jgi:hypothetical protein
LVDEVERCGPVDDDVVRERDLAPVGDAALELLDEEDDVDGEIPPQAG